VISQTMLLISLSLLDTKSVAALRAHLLALPTPTATLSILSTLTRLLLLYTASSIGASHLVLGTSLTSLSISLISSIAQGGGFVVPQTIQEEWVPPSVERIPGDSSWERRGSLGPATQGREHEGMSSLGLVAPTTGRGEAEDSYPQAEHRPLDKRQTRLHTPNLFSASNDWPPGFIIGLERDYPSTVSTIAKTAGKLAPKGESGERCILCELWVVQYGSHLRPFTKRNNF
jgi:cytoplasmic tRNA 2-thiolation protein 2